MANGQSLVDCVPDRTKAVPRDALARQHGDPGSLEPTKVAAAEIGQVAVTETGGNRLCDQPQLTGSSVDERANISIDAAIVEREHNHRASRE